MLRVGVFAGLLAVCFAHGLMHHAAPAAAPQFGNFVHLWTRYHTGYNKEFVEYCNNYITSKPHGQYISYAKQYVNQYGSGYGAPTGPNFVNLWTQYHTGYNKEFVNYCNNYVATEPHGQYVSYAKQYLDQYGSGYGVSSGPTFVNLWTQYHTGYNKEFVDYCNNYITSNPHGQYINYAKQYMAKYGSGYGAPTGPNFVDLWNQYHAGYNKEFVGYCNNYITSKPHGQYVSYAKQYVDQYGSGYGAPTGPNFVTLWNQYHTGYNKEFVGYCNNYITTEPHGQYISYAKQYVDQYGHRAITRKATTSHKFDDFYNLWGEYGSQYSKYFYDYCNSYLASHPSGQFGVWAGRYVDKFARFAGHSNVGGSKDNFAYKYGSVDEKKSDDDNSDTKPAPLDPNPAPILPKKKKAVFKPSTKALEPLQKLKMPTECLDKQCNKANETCDKDAFQKFNCGVCNHLKIKDCVKISL